MEKITEKLINFASILEPKTKAQACVTATMPFIYPHLALMPDAHLGKGATVGSVIPTIGAIMPAAVGVDIGCVDADSEYLAPDGWHRIADYLGGPVMQYDPADGTGRFVVPSAYVVKEATSFYHLHSKYGVNQMLTPDHRVLCWKITGRERRREQIVLTAEEFVEKDRGLVQGFKAEFATTFAPTLDTKLDLTDDEIRVQVMISADATLVGNRAVLHLVKERKIDRARLVLQAANVPFHSRAHRDGTTTMYVTPPVLSKDLTLLWKASQGQLQVIADECLHWDGNLDDRVYFTRVKEHADFIQYAFTACGYRAVMREDTHSRDGKIDYRVFANTNTMVGMAGSDRSPISEVPSADGKAYCFTVPSSFWVMRRGGNIVMTGNCGMMAVRTSLTADDMQHVDLKTLHKQISRDVPLSAGAANSKLTHSAHAKIAELEGLPGIAQADEVLPHWRFQMGTLGSGNHFIELSYDEEDRVWLFLHSGSRGVGNKLAMRHISAAQQYCLAKGYKLPDRDLAYLEDGTPEFTSYIEALTWAQRFAFLNREEMMLRVKLAVEAAWARACVFLNLPRTKVLYYEEVNCHHNYTEPMNIFPDEFGSPMGTPPVRIYISRKGAIEASKGTMGLIPGSMGDKSYVVRGRGNTEALWSAPHGAGRNFSRSAAKREFTREDLNTRMEGIVWGESDAFIDEHPLAYKNISIVMEDAQDLVEVVHELRQFVNVKGS